MIQEAAVVFGVIGIILAVIGTGIALYGCYVLLLALRHKHKELKLRIRQL